MADNPSQGHKQGCEVSLLERTVAAICNLMCGLPAPPLETVLPFLPILQPALSSSEIRTVCSALTALHAFVLGEAPDRIQLLLDAGAVARVLELGLTSESVHVLTAAERVLESLSAGTIDQAKTLIGMQALAMVQRVVGAYNQTGPKPRKPRLIAMLRALCNLCAGDEAVLASILEARLLSEAVRLCETQREDVLQIVVTAVSFAVSAASDAQAAAILELGALPLVCRYLTDGYSAEATLVEAVTCLRNLLAKCTSVQQFDGVIRVAYEAHCWLAVDELRSHESAAVKEAACSIHIERLRNKLLKLPPTSAIL